MTLPVAILAVAALAPARQAVQLALTLPIVPGAVEVKRHLSSATPSVEYQVRESYPAPQTIAQLVDLMAKAGWKQAEGGGFHGSWPKPAELATSRIGRRALWPVHLWFGRWQGPGGHEALFRLTYSCPMEAAGMHSVWIQVSGAVYDPESAARQRAVREQFHKQCRAGEVAGPECEN